MGSGTLTAGRFNLTLSLRHDASATRIEEWRRSFERASELLFDATDGQHQLGDIHVFNNSTGGRNADAYLMNSTGRSISSVNALGRSGRMNLNSDERFKPFVVIHEFGHYGYGLRDEYEDINGREADCIGGTTSDACIMETDWSEGDRFGERGIGGPLVIGRVSEFCVASNHDPDRDTEQHARNGESCWETMARRFTDLTTPPDVPTGPPPTTHTPINWIVAPTEPRFLILVDSLQNELSGVLAGVKHGAAWWADSVSDGDLLGIISSTSTGAINFPLQVVSNPGDRDRARTAAAGIIDGAQTSLAAGMREALNQIRGAGPRAATQVIVLITDGARDGQEDLAALVSDSRESGVNVYVVDVSVGGVTCFLGDVASTTFGHFYKVEPNQSPKDQQFAILNAFIEILGDVRENSGAIITQAGELENDASLKSQVLIESGSEAATFVISWEDPQSKPLLNLNSPDGRQVAVELNNEAIYPDTGRLYESFRIDNPMPGDWTLDVKPERAGGPVKFRTFVFSQNQRISGDLFSPSLCYRKGDAVPLQLEVSFDQSLTGLIIDAIAQLPDGSKRALTFSDDGYEDLNDIVPKDGVYNTVFRTTGEPGVYTFEVTVRNDGESAIYADVCEKPLPGEEVEKDPIPAFQRQFRLSVIVTEALN